MALTPEEKPPSYDAARRQFGNYVLGRQIGAGGMGVVYEARRVDDERRLAVKVIRDFYVTSATTLTRFTIEAEAAARLDHPNIVRIHEIGDSNGQPFFSMDLIDGESLHAKLANGGFPGDERAMSRFMAAVARAVHHAHVRGVVHRDLKPANILIDAKGEPHLTDFGLAKILQSGDEVDAHSLTASSDVPGTPGYMSPEQVAGKQIGPASDVYALGAVLYALLTGAPPFRGASAAEVFQQITNRLPVRPRALKPAIHPDLQTICLKCLEKDPRLRYGSADDLATDLENFASGRPINARPASWTRRSSDWIKRNPVGAGLITSLCLGLSIALLLLKLVNDQRHEIQLDRDLAFDDGMQKISQIWRDPATKSVLISARELGILAGRPPVDLRGAKELTFGVTADDGPSSMAQRYARLLGNLQEGMRRHLHEKVALHLRLLKRFNQDHETLARGEVDFMTVTAVDLLRAQRIAPEVTALARANHFREGVIFARTNSGVQRLSDLRHRTVAFPDPALSITVWAKARLFAAGLRQPDLRSSTNILDRGRETLQLAISTSETIDRVLRGECDAGVTWRGQFERHRHLGLVELDRFTETPSILAARSGLESPLAAALRDAVGSAEKSESWAGTKFVADPDLAPLLDRLRTALQQADYFDASIK